MDGSDAFDGDDDAALRYAIALSLQETSKSSMETPIELSSDEDDGDLNKEPKYTPIPKNSEKSPSKQSSVRTQLEVAPAAPQQPATALASSFTALGLDRKKMEEERLARLGKRKATESESDTQDRRQRPRLDVQSPNHSATKDVPRHLPYPKGTVKKTWAAGYPRKDDIKIDEILQKNELELAVVGSFQWDERWMLSKIDCTRTKLVCIAFASDEAQKEDIKNNIPKGTAIRFCFPPMMPAGSMHSKLQLLKFPGYLRIVVPSGNFVPYDWGETGVMENMVFLIDLPKIDDPKLQSSNIDLGPFGEELRYFLRAQGLQDSLINSLPNYDFSEANRYRFVHTIGTTHVGDKWQRTGYCGLGRAVTSLGLNTTENVEVDFITASLGSLNKDLLTALYYASQGDNGLKEYETRSTKGSKNKPAPKAKLDLNDKFRIYFPSQDTVTKSRGGKDAAGTICVQSKWWDSATFPRELIRDCKSVRPGLLMHSKIIMVRHTHSNAAYAYIGSANLSESAWGRLTKERGTGNPKLTCRNWECGVIIPAQDSSTNRSQDHELSDFHNIIPVPMEIPGEAYATSKRPWLYLEN
ncbi:phospholipase D/nuclease [Hypoxylon trugodes]|uniref:phospholipase D/nuclease n=1 Tax=Hypoxylon trugodes TaxID=326681 RepID=UPI00218FC004|nr:phospholipase D/nuclease [Hypoxylon trugodes]KAI1384501.1 phospholipase D/nuclease [Hypoxylon trugodes]